MTNRKQQMTDQHKMNQTVKEKWLQALRSKEYEQNYGCLKDGNKFCCLGVLTDLYIKENNLNWTLKIENDFCERFAAPNWKVCDWADLKNPNPDVKIDKPFPDSLAGMNDHGYSFEEIADIIEQQL